MSLPRLTALPVLKFSQFGKKNKVLHHPNEVRPSPSCFKYALMLSLEKGPLKKNSSARRPGLMLNLTTPVGFHVTIYSE